MNLARARNHTKIRTMLTMAVGILLAGCGTHPAASTAQRGQALSGVTRTNDANCVAELAVGFADNGTTHCVQLHGQVTVELRLPDGSVYGGQTGVSGSSLRFLPAPNPRAWPIYGAVSSGTAVISTIQESCSSGHECLPLPSWSVNIVVP
jgi:hypothetical protein